MAKRRANGEGSAPTKRKDGRWESKVSWIDPATGKPDRKTVYGKTAAECRDKRKALLDRISEGLPPTDSKVTVGAWCAHWRETTLRAAKGESHADGQDSLLRNHVEDESSPLRDRPLRDLRASHVEGLIVHLRGKQSQRTGKPLSQSTVRSVYLALRSALDTAQRDGLIAKNPCHQLSAPSVDAPDVAHPTAEQMVAVLSYVAGRYTRAVQLMAVLGLRRGEVCGLRWEDCDLDAETPSIRVRRKLRRAKKVGSEDTGKLVLEVVKGKRARVIHVDAAVVELLREQRKAQVRERLRAGTQWGGQHELVFLTELGTRLDPRNLTRVVGNAARKAGWGRITAHSLRHGAAIGWLEAGVHIKAVADMLGHSSIAVTGDIYGHTNASVSSAAVSTLTSALLPAANKASSADL